MAGSRVLASGNSVTGGRSYFGANPLTVPWRYRTISRDLGNELGISELEFHLYNAVELAGQASTVLEAGGFDVLQFEVNDPEVKSKARVLARFANAPNALMLSGHGSYQGWSNLGGPNIVLASRTGPTPPEAFSSERWLNIKTLIIAGCVSGNFNDYALNSRRYLQGQVAESFFERIPISSPARTLKSMIHPQGKILGYQSGAPESPNDQPPIRRFFDKLDATGASFSNPAVARLWVAAHAEVDFLDNASALDSNAFYFMTFAETAGPVREVPLLGKRQTIYHKERWLVKVDRADWDKPLKSEHRFGKLSRYPNIEFEVAP